MRRSLFALSIVLGFLVLGACGNDPQSSPQDKVEVKGFDDKPDGDITEVTAEQMAQQGLTAVDFEGNPLVAAQLDPRATVGRSARSIMRMEFHSGVLAASQEDDQVVGSDAQKVTIGRRSITSFSSGLVNNMQYFLTDECSVVTANGRSNVECKKVNETPPTPMPDPVELKKQTEQCQVINGVVDPVVKKFGLYKSRATGQVYRVVYTLLVENGDVVCGDAKTPHGPGRQQYFMISTPSLPSLNVPNISYNAVLHMYLAVSKDDGTLMNRFKLGMVF